jgi:hypothetical protein
VEIVYAEIVADADMCKPIAERFDQLTRPVGLLRPAPDVRVTDVQVEKEPSARAGPDGS